MPIGIATAAVGVGKAIIGSNAANQAAKAQQQASQQNLQTEQAVQGQTTGNLQPFVGYGQNAGNALQGLLAGNSSAFDAFRNSTNYQFLLDQGLQGQAYLNAPNLFSGATGKALNNYAQGMAGNALQGYEGLLQNQEQMGIGAGASLGYINSGLAAQQAQARNLAAGAQGSAGLYGANQFGNALGGLGNLFGQSSFSNPFGGGFNPSQSALGAFQPNPGLDQAWNSAANQYGMIGG